MFSHEHCGRCGSRGLLKVPATPGNHSHIVVHGTRLRAIDVCKYVCTDCGCVEEWVNGRDDLQRLKDEWLQRPDLASE